VLAVVEEVPTTHRLGLLAQEELAVVVRVLKVLEQPLQARRILAVVVAAQVELVAEILAGYGEVLVVLVL
jgi:hypothetical protein